jgi:hypothetical protein
MRVIVVVLAGVLAGCGSCAEKVAQVGLEKATGVKVDVNGDKAVYTGKDGTRIETSENRMVVTGPNGEKQVLGADQKLPDDLPIKAPSDAKVGLTSSVNGIQMVSFETVSAARTLADDFVKQLEAKGFKVGNRVEQKSDEGELVLLGFEGKDLDVSVQLGAQAQEGEALKTTATVTWQKKPSP